MPVDLAAAEGPGLLVQRALDDHGRVDVLVNNVGRRAATPRRLSRHWGRGVRVGHADELLHRAARHPGRLPNMVDRVGGAIVNVASVNAFFQPDAGTIDYGAAKAALLNLSKSLAQEFGAKGIHVNCVSPGPVGTDLWLGEHGVAETVAAASRRGRRHGSRDASSRASGGSRPVDSRRRRRSPRSSCCWPLSEPPTSPAPTTSSTVG